jgi:hypothetical protein
VSFPFSPEFQRMEAGENLLYKLPRENGRQKLYWQVTRTNEREHGGIRNRYLVLDDGGGRLPTVAPSRLREGTAAQRKPGNVAFAGGHLQFCSPQQKPDVSAATPKLQSPVAAMAELHDAPSDTTSKLLRREAVELVRSAELPRLVNPEFAHHDAVAELPRLPLVLLQTWVELGWLSSPGLEGRTRGRCPRREQAMAASLVHGPGRAHARERKRRFTPSKWGRISPVPHLRVYSYQGPSHSSTMEQTGHGWNKIVGLTCSHGHGGPGPTYQ